jgi:hypothetical protein
MEDNLEKSDKSMKEGEMVYAYRPFLIRVTIDQEAAGPFLALFR